MNAHWALLIQVLRKETFDAWKKGRINEDEENFEEKKNHK